MGRYAGGRHGILRKAGIPAGCRVAEWEKMCSGGTSERPVASCVVTDLSRGIGQGKHGVRSLVVFSEGRRPEVGQRNWGLNVRRLLGDRSCGGDVW